MSGRYASAQVVIPLPVVVSTILALVAGGLQTLSAIVFAADPEIRGVIAVFIVFLAAEGIDPLTGRAFATAVHLPPWAVHLLSAAVAAFGGAIQIVPMSHGLSIGLIDLLTVLGALGFGTAPLSPPLLAASAAVIGPVGRAIP